MPRKLILALAATAALSACSRDSGDDSAAVPAAPAETPSDHAFAPAINEADFAKMVETLASDEFEGRAPGSPGEEKTVAYIAAQMERIGLQPGNGDSWYQDVSMVETSADEDMVLKLEQAGETRDLAFGSDMVIGTRSGQTSISVKDSELVFVGYGVDAPEQDWDDYGGDQDWKGKTVVMLVNDPGFHANDESLFDGKRMTYYGRWTYKYEEAARKGADAALIIHDTAGASYGWDVVKNSWSGAQYDLTVADDPDPRLPAQGWITTEVAKRLFADAGLDLDQAYASANKRGFKPVPLDAKLSFDLDSSISQKTSRNVIGVLPGTDRADEAVLYMAHWDHLGKQEGDGDQIYNGAVDNATGVAGILEIAHAFATQEPKPKRSVVFLAVTLEESGLLGSKYYVAQPTFPLAKIAGVINLDAMQPTGKSRDFNVTGFGSSQLEDILKPIAAEQGRTLRGETSVESGFYFRSDHFNFAKAGVPALYADGGEDLIEGGADAGRAAATDYGKNRYHQAADEYDPATWKFDGIIDDLKALHGVGKELAGGEQWPNWYEGNPFKAARDEMMPAAK